MHKLCMLASVIGFTIASSAAAAATQVINGSNQLTGATGVNINGSIYTVEFVDGTCATYFGGCDATSDFTFTTFGAAQMAAQALLDQVLLDTAGGQFDSNYTLTFGCATNGNQLCNIAIPYSVPSIGLGNTVNAANTNTTDSVNPANGSPNLNTAQDDSLVLARFTLTGSVPEPSSWAMMLLGFSAIGAALRMPRKRLIGAA